MKEKPQVYRHDFEALVLFTKQLHTRLERLENGLPAMPQDQRLQPAPLDDKPAITRDQHNERLNELEHRIEGIEQHLERQLRGG